MTKIKNLKARLSIAPQMSLDEINQCRNKTGHQVTKGPANAFYAEVSNAETSVNESVVYIAGIREDLQASVSPPQRIHVRGLYAIRKQGVKFYPMEVVEKSSHSVILPQEHQISLLNYIHRGDVSKQNHNRATPGSLPSLIQALIPTSSPGENHYIRMSNESCHPTTMVESTVADNLKESYLMPSEYSVDDGSRSSHILDQSIANAILQFADYYRSQISDRIAKSVKRSTLSQRETNVRSSVRAFQRRQKMKIDSIVESCTLIESPLIKEAITKMISDLEETDEGDLNVAWPQNIFNEFQQPLNFAIQINPGSASTQKDSTGILGTK